MVTHLLPMLVLKLLGWKLLLYHRIELQCYGGESFDAGAPLWFLLPRTISSSLMTYRNTPYTVMVGLPAYRVLRVEAVS